MSQPHKTESELTEVSYERSTLNEDQAARRRVLQGLAWGVPAILVTSTAPAFAASKDNSIGEW